MNFKKIQSNLESLLTEETNKLHDVEINESLVFVEQLQKHFPINNDYLQLSVTTKNEHYSDSTKVNIITLNKIKDTGYTYNFNIEIRIDNNTNRIKGFYGDRINFSFEDTQSEYEKLGYEFKALELNLLNLVMNKPNVIIDIFTNNSYQQKLEEQQQFTSVISHFIDNFKRKIPLNLIIDEIMEKKHAKTKFAIHQYVMNKSCHFNELSFSKNPSGTYNLNLLFDGKLAFETSRCSRDTLNSVLSEMALEILDEEKRN